MCNSFVFRVLLLNGLLEYCVFRQKERQKGLQRPRWRLKCFYSDLRILSNGSQAILWHPAMSFAFLEDKQDKSICNELFTWADVYDTANHDERRAILQQFIKEIRVRKDYEISITLNASFNQVEQLKAVSTYDGAEIFEEISEKGA